MGTETDFGSALAAQRVFREVMDAFAHPFAARCIAAAASDGAEAASGAGGAEGMAGADGADSAARASAAFAATAADGMAGVAAAGGAASADGATGASPATKASAAFAATAADGMAGVAGMAAAGGAASADGAMGASPATEASATASASAAATADGMAGAFDATASPASPATAATGADSMAGAAAAGCAAGTTGADGAAAIKAICGVFLDNTVSFYVHGDDRLAAEIRESTYARPSGLEDADFVVVRDAAGFGLWDRVRQGSLVNPHRGATVIVGVPRIAGDAEIAAEGPGIDGQQLFRVDRRIGACVRQAAELGMEYPKGFELVFASGQGEICAVPRHIKTRGGEAV